MTDKYTLENLRQLMARLRDPQRGCPWDVKQTNTSIAPSTLEEAYEVIEAIETGDHQQLREELGDLLFQVVFYARIAEEEQQFDLNDVVDGITSKLLARHPHVFPDGTLNSEVRMTAQGDHELRGNWESLKRQEREKKGQSGILADIPRALPALTRALKIQKRLATVGFDWDSVALVLDKVDEEQHELRAAIVSGSRDAMEDELGDCLFVLANLARHLHLDPERALRRTNRKVEQRFAYVEQQLVRTGLQPADATLEQMEALWQEAKGQGGAGVSATE